MSTPLIKRVDAEWNDVVLVCRKCSRKLDGGFGPKGDKRLAKALRKALGSKAKDKDAPVGVIEVGCFDICPDNAVTVVRGAAPKTWAVIRKGTPVGEILAHLGLAPKS